MSQRSIISKVVICFLVLSFSSVVFADNSTDTMDIAISGNFWLPGTVNVEGTDVDKTAGILLRVFVDSYIAEKFCVGAFLNLAKPTFEYGSISESGDMYEFGVALKYVTMLNTMRFKMGLNIGYRKINNDLLDDAIEGLGVNLSAELQFNPQADIIPFIEGGFLTQPSGGNEDVEVTWSPILYFGGGVAF